MANPTDDDPIRELGKMAARDPEVLWLLEILCIPWLAAFDNSEVGAFERRASFRVIEGGDG